MENTIYYTSNAKSVNIAGSFNGWCQVPMTKLKDNLFCYELKNTVSEPTYIEYKLVLNGSEWICDPNVQTIKTDGGTINNVFVMKPPATLPSTAQVQSQQSTQLVSKSEGHEHSQQQETPKKETLSNSTETAPKVQEERQTIESNQSANQETTNHVLPDASSVEISGTYRIHMFGDASVGKTSLLNRFVDDAFDPDVQTTIGLDYREKIVQVDGKYYRITLADTAGQERFRAMTRRYYSQTDAAIIVFDCTSLASFESLLYWAKELDQHPNITFKILLCNKMDLTNMASFETDAASDFAESRGLIIKFVSAKTGSGVSDAFDLVIQELIKTKKSKEDVVINLEANEQNENNSSCSC